MFNKNSMGMSEIDVLFQKKREEMTKSEERNWVNFCYNAYEFGGFREHFTTPYEQYGHYSGFKFKVIGRCTEEEGYDLCVLPMWHIAFLDEDGTPMNFADAYPEEITLIDTNMKIPNPMVSRTDFIEKYSDTLKEHKIVLFDSRDYGENEVNEMIRSNSFKKGTIVCNIEDFKQVFRSMEPVKYEDMGE